MDADDPNTLDNVISLRFEVAHRSDEIPKFPVVALFVDSEAFVMMTRMSCEEFALPSLTDALKALRQCTRMDYWDVERDSSRREYILKGVYNAVRYRNYATVPPLLTIDVLKGEE